MLSAVRVFPVPGGPCSTPTRPRPLPEWECQSHSRLNLKTRLTFYDVVNIVLGFMCVRLHESSDNVFLFIWHDERVESAIVPLDIIDARNGKLGPELFAKAETEYYRVCDKIFFVSELALARVLSAWNLLDVLFLDYVALFIDW